MVTWRTELFSSPVITILIIDYHTKFWLYISIVFNTLLLCGCMSFHLSINLYADPIQVKWQSSIEEPGKLSQECWPYYLNRLLLSIGTMF